jgi:CheY-like chemotaxis protein
MGRVLILEPDPEVRELISRVVSRLGHEPLAPARLPARVPSGVDAVFLEPAWAPALELAGRLRERNPKLPVVFESIDPASPGLPSLTPVRHLLKPFGLRVLEQAIEAVLPS